MPKENIEDLAANIKVNGLLEPLVLRPNPEAEGKFILVAGERRFRALKLNEATEADTRIRLDVTDKWDAKGLAVVENDARDPLSQLEMGYTFQEMVEKGNKSIEEIARVIGGKERMRTVRRCLDLVKLDPSTQKLVASEQVSARAALELGKLDDDTRAKVVNELQAKGKEAITEDSVKATAKAIARGTEDAATANAKSSPKKSSKAASLVVWRGNKAASATLSDLCVRYVEASKEESNRGTTEWYEMRGAIAVLLYLRSDLANLTMPAEESESAPAAPADKKVLVLFDKLVNAEASRALKVAKAQEAAAPEDKKTLAAAPEGG
jgi:ParB family chromosome partitioning protein